MYISDSKKKLVINHLVRILHFILAVFIILWLNVGVFTYISPFIQDLAKLLVFLVWFGIACFSKKNYLTNYIFKIMPLMVFYGIVFVMNLYTNSSELQLYIVSFRYLFIIYSIFLFYSSDTKLMKIILALIFFDLLYVGINSYILLQTNPGVARYLATSLEKQEILLGDAIYHGIGSYSYAYSLVITGLLLLFNIIHGHNKKLLSLLGLVAMIFLLLNMQFTIAILLLFICGFYLIYTKASTKVGAVISGVLGIVIFLLFYNLLPNLFEFISNINNMPRYVSERLYEISLFFRGGYMDETDMFLRFNLYRISLETFFHNVFFGSLTEPIGNHSAWLDLLGRFGLLATPLLVFFIKEYKRVLSKLNSKSQFYVKTSYLYYLILGFINTAFFAQLFLMLFVIVPYSAFLFERQDSDKIEYAGNAPYLNFRG